MDNTVAAILGALQGLTEFLPVSSSGHVAIGALLFGIPDMPLTMVVIVHAGTLLATLLVVGGDVARLTASTARGLSSPREFLESEQGRIVSGVVLATVPTGVIGLLIEERVEQWAHMPWVVGLCLLLSALIVLSTRRGDGKLTTLGPRAYLLIGLAQGLAVLPGVSRSGTTIAAGMLLGLKAPEAFRFSFLLSLPAIFGAVVLKVSEPGAIAQLGTAALIAGSVALLTGYFALRLLQHVVMQGRLWAFAAYLIPAGLGLVAWDLLS